MTAAPHTHDDGLREARRLAWLRDVSARMAAENFAFGFAGGTGAAAQAMVLVKDDPFPPTGATGMDAALEVARFTPQALIDDARFLADAPAAVQFLIGLVDRAAGVVRNQRAELKRLAERLNAEARGDGDGEGEAATAGAARERVADLTTECAIACTKDAWRLFLAERSGAPVAPGPDAAAAMRAALDVASRAELNSDAGAAARWRALRGEFHAWLRGKA